jgi:hypothetical protein
VRTRTTIAVAIAGAGVIVLRGLSEDAGSRAGQTADPATATRQDASRASPVTRSVPAADASVELRFQAPATVRRGDTVDVIVNIDAKRGWPHFVEDRLRSGNSAPSACLKSSITRTTRLPRPLCVSAISVSDIGVFDAAGSPIAYNATFTEHQIAVN